MKRKLASVCKIESVEPAEKSDFLSVVQLEGKRWRIVVKRNEFRVGARVVYFEIDSALPADDERFAFLTERCLAKVGSRFCFRIRTLKLRGIVSQGLVLPFAAFPEIADAKDGDDVSETLRVKLYDDFFEENNVRSKNLFGDIRSPFPIYLPKTDEERIQNLAYLLEEESLQETEFEVTEKYDGTSATFFYSPTFQSDFGVCSRNLQLRETKENIYWTIARRLQIEEVLKRAFEEENKELAIQGEIVGPGISGNRDKYDDFKFFVFRIYDVAEQTMFDADRRYDFCANYGLDRVKVLDPRVKAFQKFRSVDEIVRYAEGKTDRGNEREGVVFKARGSNSFSFKAINNKYLIKHGL